MSPSLAPFTLPTATLLALVVLTQCPAQASAQDARAQALEFGKLVLVPGGFRLELFATEPMVKNAVAFDIDARGRVWIAESDRQEHHGVPDNRSHTYWIDDDLKALRVEDRGAMYVKHLPQTAHEWTQREDRVRLTVDRDGDGIADHSTVFAGGFKDLLDGTAAGVLEVDGRVLFTCIPHVWELADRDGDGVAEHRKSLHRGYGVRVALRGHDLHGLVHGPDDRIYFSIGDRGYHIELPDGRVLKDPDAGAVFRCEPDGSQLEVVHMGLRNPQELAFDDRGDLWTVDNNSDAGDRARVIHLVPGGDSGWRMNYQYRPDRGPWMPEHWWKPRHPGQPAFLNAPLANLGSGPSGLFHDPGLALPESHRGRFFFSDFLGSVSHSGVRSFAVVEDGAGFQVGDNDLWLRGILTTDVAPGPDGAVWVLDWVEGWVGVDRGRIWRVVPEGEAAQAIAAETRKWLEAELLVLSQDVLVPLLDHRDRRVRDRAHRALAQKSDGRALWSVAMDAKASPRARSQALFGLEIRARRAGEDLSGLAELLDDPSALVRERAAKTLGAAKTASAAAKLVRRLGDAAPRVQAAAAHALAAVGGPDAVAPLLELARINADRDAVLRHAIAMALAGIAAREDTTNLLLGAAPSAEPAVRLAIALALRRLASPRLARFLDDQDPFIATEAALAIHDVPIPGAWSDLAERLTPGRPEPFLRRALSAADLLSESQHAEALARFAASAEAPASLRAEALDVLATWESPRPFDRVLNTHRPRPPRTKADAERVLAPIAATILRGAPAPVLEATARAAVAYRLEDCVAPLDAIARDEAAEPSARIAALRALRKLFRSGLHDLIAVLLKSALPEVRGAALEALVDVRPDAALAVLGPALEASSVHERQLALIGLGRLDPARTEPLIVRTLERALEDRFPRDAWLELLEVADKRGAEAAAIQALAQKLKAKVRPDQQQGVLYPLALEGGHPEVGRKLFFEHAAASCQRCHAVGPDGRASDVSLAGPRLDGVGSRLTRQALLESIIDPNKAIAQGYENVMIETKDGRVVRGRLVRESASTLHLEVLEAGEWEPLDLPTKDIDTRTREASSMPTDLAQKLSLRELRDIVAWLATLQTEGFPAGPAPEPAPVGR